MKVILYMGITVNGYIARENGDSEWTSEEDLKGFEQNSRSAGNIIMGKNTYLYASQAELLPFKDALNVVVSHGQIENKYGDKVLVTDKNPKEVLKMLEEKGFSEAFLAGGGQLNTAFLKENLIDEIYLDVEPLLFGKGVKVFAESDFDIELELIESKPLNKNTVQLHYKVLK
jgi:dihydrofolate reductase